MTEFVHGGPQRFRHQLQGLRKLLATGGVAALLFDPGCLSGDTLVTVNRGGKSFKISLRDLESRFNGGQPYWRADIATSIQRDAGGSVRLARVVRVASAGVQVTHTLITEDGRAIRATADHPFATPAGMRRLDSLVSGDEVLVNSGRSQTGRGAKIMYRERAGLRFHPQAVKRNSSHSPYRVPEHRLVIEAEMNALSLADYCQRLRVGTWPGVVFLGPSEHVHHIDRDPANNDRRNLLVLSEQEHHRLHAAEGTGRNVLERVSTVKVASVTRWGEEEVFDVTVEDDPHTFIAGTFSVGNTGKTAVAIDYACLLALKVDGGEARVLVIAPSAACDTWVLQMRTFASPLVGWWAGVPGGSVTRRVQTLAWLGGQPFKGAARPGPVPVSDSSGPAGATWRWPGDAGTPRVTLAVLGIEAMSSRAEVGSRTMADVILDGVRRFGPHLVIVDESHRIKGASANASRLAARIGDSAQRRMILTGTVQPHSPMDVFAQWRFLDPYAFGPVTGAGVKRKATMGGFENRYAVKGGFMGRQIMSYCNLDEMAQIMSRSAVVARKDDVLDLPPVTDSVVPATLQPAEQRAYDELMADFATTLASGERATADGFLHRLMKLRQVTSGFISDDQGKAHRVGDSKEQAIASIVSDSLAGEKRVVVFCLFVAEIASLASRLAARGTRVEVITGATPEADRRRIRAEFGVPSPQRIVLLAQARTMSIAVNELVTASHAVFGSLSQLRDDWVQARDRLNRTGQVKPVTFWTVLGQRAGHTGNAAQTVDGVILDSHFHRTSLEAGMLRYVREYESGGLGLSGPAMSGALGMFT